MHDARLVAAMRMEIRRILTFDAKDLARFTDIEVQLPKDVLANP